MLDQIMYRLSGGQLLALAIVLLIVTGGAIKCAHQLAQGPRR